MYRTNIRPCSNFDFNDLPAANERYIHGAKLKIPRPAELTGEFLDVRLENCLLILVSFLLYMLRHPIVVTNKKIDG